MKHSASAGKRIAETARLLEQVEGKRGLEWEVVLIEAGLSANGNLYPEEVLRCAVPLFEGIKAFADHATQTEIRERPERSVEEIVGWFESPRFEGRGIRATFKLSPAAHRLRELLVDAWERRKQNLIGFSVDALAQCEERRTPQGVINEVKKIVKVFSVDVVTDPAAGGNVLRLVAAARTADLSEENEQMKERLHALLVKVDPAAAQSLSEDATAEEVLVALEKVPANEGVENRRAKEGAGRTSAPPAPPDERHVHEARLSACNAVLESHLFGSGLPLPVQAAVRRDFGARIFESRELLDRLAEDRKVWAAVEGSGQVRGLGDGIQFGDDQSDKLGMAMDGFFAGRDIGGVPRFRSFKEAYRKVTGDWGDAYQILQEAYPYHMGERTASSPRLREAALARIRESLSTTSWAEILGDSIARRMIAEYQLPQLQDWRKIVSDVTSVPDFRTQRRMRMGGYGTLPTVAERGTYQSLTSPGDEEVTYAATKRGGTDDLTLEMIANDDVGAIRRIPVKLGRAAAITLYRFAFDFINDNPTMDYDSTALFHANHNNLGSTALASAQLDTARQQMRSQSAFGASTEILGIVPKVLLVPNELEHLAWRLVTSPVLITTNEDATSPNLHQRSAMEVIVVDYWTDANDWAVVCDPVMCPTIEIGFFEGREEPEIFVQDVPNVGDFFDADVITYKIRHIYGGDVLDHRGMWKAVVA